VRKGLVQINVIYGKVSKQSSCLVGEADAFALPLAFMFANYLVNFVGQFTGRKLSLPTLGAFANDLLNLLDNWMKNIVWRAAFFAYFLWL
jgi:hypothetical protein